MPVINGVKFACASCIRGHRSGKCAHQDRILQPIKSQGRPSRNCMHKIGECQCPGMTNNLRVAVPNESHCLCGPSDVPAKHDGEALKNIQDSGSMVAERPAKRCKTGGEVYVVADPLHVNYQPVSPQSVTFPPASHHMSTAGIETGPSTSLASIDEVCKSAQGKDAMIPQRSTARDHRLFHVRSSNGMGSSRPTGRPQGTHNRGPPSSHCCNQTSRSPLDNPQWSVPVSPLFQLDQTMARPMYLDTRFTLSEQSAIPLQAAESSTTVPKHHCSSVRPSSVLSPVLTSHHPPQPSLRSPEPFLVFEEAYPTDDSISDYRCQCGLACNCKGCLAHPNNPANQPFLRSLAASLPRQPSLAGDDSYSDAIQMMQAQDSAEVAHPLISPRPASLTQEGNDLFRPESVELSALPQPSERSSSRSSGYSSFEAAFIADAAQA